MEVQKHHGVFHETSPSISTRVQKAMILGN